MSVLVQHHVGGIRHHGTAVAEERLLPARGRLVGEHHGRQQSARVRPQASGVQCRVQRTLEKRTPETKPLTLWTPSKAESMAFGSLTVTCVGVAVAGGRCTGRYRRRRSGEAGRRRGRRRRGGGIPTEVGRGNPVVVGRLAGRARTVTRYWASSGPARWPSTSVRLGSCRNPPATSPPRSSST